MTRVALVLAVSALALTLSPSAAAAQSELVIAKEKPRFYHRAACPVVADMTDIIAMTRAQAESRGYKAHPECDPANPSAPMKAVPPPVTVYLDGSKYYHRKDCAKLKDVKTPKAARLEEAGKTLWPCPTCKPPRREKRGDDIELGRRRGR